MRKTLIGFWAATLMLLLIISIPSIAQDETEPYTIEPVTRNAGWTPIIQTFNGVEMVLVPPGCFMMGSENGYADDRPVHEICFDEPFWIDRYEVTNAQFTTLGGTAGKQPYFEGENIPRESVSWFEAEEFCTLRDGRLPTESEWEYAARGPDNLIYPWGDSASSRNVASPSALGGELIDVGSRPGGASWVGAHDLIGNVWEWVSSIYASYPYVATDGREDPNDQESNRVIRGGSFNFNASDFRATSRYNVMPSFTLFFIGFRCARPFDPSSDILPIPPETIVVPEENAPPDYAVDNPITTNNDWTPIVETIRGVEMVLVPPGCFDMGSTQEQIDAAFAAYERIYCGGECPDDRRIFEAEAPQHPICFDEPFWIDSMEVTGAMYSECVASGDCIQPSESDYTSRDTQPVNRITWFEARDYCWWRGDSFRLPTEAEWEYAARGPDNLLYPWGNEFIDDNVVYAENSNMLAADAGSKASGVSWAGAYDLSGNMWEWVGTVYSGFYYPYPYDASDGRENYDDLILSRVARGGSFASPDKYALRATIRFGLSPDYSDDDLSFRCVREYDGL